MNINLLKNPKVKPLIISFLFAFLGILVGQKLLSYENENVILSHCRKLNLQHIFTYNNLDNIPYSFRPKVLELLDLEKYCYKYLSKEVKDQLEIMDNYPLKDYEILYEVVGFKMRLYADSFNRLENTRSDAQSKMLISLLALNVASLGTQAVFLREDSKQIEEES